MDDADLMKYVMREIRIEESKKKVLTDTNLVERAVRAAHIRGMQRVTAVMRSFSIPWSVANELCERFDLDPDEILI